MKMIRMTKDKFLSYVLDERKDKYRNFLKEIYFINPKDSHGGDSSFVAVVVIGAKSGEVYVGISKYNTMDTKKVQRPISTSISPKEQAKIKKEIVVSGFSLEEGLKQACNRVWREIMNMPSLYGKDHGPHKPKRVSVSVGISLTRLIRSIPPFPFDTHKKFNELMAAEKRYREQKMLTAAKQSKGEPSETSKSAH